MAELTVPQLPPEMAHQQALTAMGGLYAAALRALVDKFGSEDALKMLDPYLKAIGKEMAAIAPFMGITGKDAVAIASLMHTAEEQVLKVVGKPTEVSPDRVVKEITQCPFQGSAPELCLSMRSMCEGICEAINPDYGFSMPKFIPKGDPICQWIVHKR